MNVKMRIATTVLAALILGAIPTGKTTAAPERPPVTIIADATVENLVARMPADNAQQGAAVSATFLALGPDAITELCKLIIPPGTGDDTKARWALSNLVKYTASYAPEDRRAMVARAVADVMNAADDKEVQAFLIRQLQVVGKTEVVPDLAGWLTDAALCEPAAQALQTIGGEAAGQALLKALGEADEALKTTLIQALGQLRVAAAVSQIVPHAESADRDRRLTALRALANIGAPQGHGLLREAMEDESAYVRARATSWLMLYAQRRAATSVSEAVSVAQQLIQGAETESHVRSAALSLMVELKGDSALINLLAAMDSEDIAYRAAALNLATKMEGDDITEKWMERLVSAAPAAQAEILVMLARRGDRAALPTLRQSLRSSHEVVQLAAIEALLIISPEAAAADLLDILSGEPSEAVAAVAQAGLSRIPTDQLVGALIAAYADAPAPLQATILETLAERRAGESADLFLTAVNAEDDAVRQAARGGLRRVVGTQHVRPLVDLLRETARAGESVQFLQNALVDAIQRSSRPSQSMPVVLMALHEAPDAERIPLIAITPRIGGSELLQLVIFLTGSENADMADAAIRALAEWPNAEALNRLLEIAAESDSQTHRVLALRGYTRLLIEWDVADRHRLVMIARGLGVAPTADTIRPLLSAMGQLKTLDALEPLVPFLDHEEVREEARLAFAAIVASNDPQEARPALEALRDAASDDGARQFLAEQLQSLFNLALNRPVKTTVGNEGDNVPELAVDGQVTLGSAWHGADTPATFEVDLGEAREIGGFQPIFYWDGSRYYQYTISVSADGENWEQVVDRSANTQPSTQAGIVDAVETQGRHVRLTITRNSANPACHLVEFRVFPRGGVVDPTPTPPAPPDPTPDADGFVSMFNGEDLTGWVGATDTYVVEDGVIVVRPERGGGGNLYTDKAYSDFIMEFEFKLTPGANNGLGIRTPLSGDPAYVGMELQILDNTADHYANLDPRQYHGSVYGIAAAKRGFLKPVGEWNHQRVVANGPDIEVILNDESIVKVNLDEAHEAGEFMSGRPHPGMYQTIGHIAFCGHGDVVFFRNLRIKEIEPPLNTPPPGFRALFNGRDLEGWKGLMKAPFDNPIRRAALSDEERAERQAEADELMRAHWSVEEGVLVFDGKGLSLATDRDYGDFEMMVDWKILPQGDSGVYLRGSPQVQIWDPNQHSIGSGGLYNNQIHPSVPSRLADRPIGEWNRFRIRMVGEKVSIWLNGYQVLDEVIMENYWDRSQPIFPREQIELQNHGNTLWFRNVFLRELD